jgi:hypothetical protein
MIAAIKAESRAEAEEIADDLADSVADVYGYPMVAIITQDPNLLERLQITYEGEEL